jgi:hypothetical protein
LNLSLPDAVLSTGTVWIPLLRTPNIDTYYFVGLSGLGIGGVQLPIPQNSFKGGTTIDLVTTYTRPLRLVYMAFRNPYLANAINLPRALVTTVFHTCYKLSCLDLIRVPNVSFFFSAGQILTL